VRIQAVYQNFQAHYVTLSKCAEKDIAHFNNIAPSAAVLRSNPRLKLYTLGFLKMLTEIDDFSPETESWLKYYSSRPSCAFKPISLDEIGDCFNGFALFLDEFVATPLNTLMRNIGRAAQIPTIVANTNAKIANLVDPTGAVGSGATNTPVWSLVVTRLDSALISSLDAVAPLATSTSLQVEESATTVITLDEALGRIISLNPEGAASRFLRHFRESQLSELRPGIAAYVVAILKRFALDLPLGNEFSLGMMLDWICKQLQKLLAVRKPQLFSEDLAASIGHIALLLPESYFTYNVTSPARGRISSWRQPMFLERHLFYLENPADSSNRFLTFPPGPGNTEMFLKLRITSSQSAPWTEESAAFRQEEFFALAGCLFIAYFQTAIRLFARTTRRTANVTRSNNPNAVSLDGNALETQAAVCITRATHYRMVGTVAEFSFKGLVGVDFLSNVIHQLKQNSQIFPIHLPEKLLSTLSELRIPFLYGINRDAVAVEDDPFVQFSSFDDEFFTSQYTRTSNSAQIDGIFKARKAGTRGEFGIVCECKNRNARIDANILVKSLKRLERRNAYLGLIVCKESIKSPGRDTDFARLCEEKSFHVYRVASTTVPTTRYVLKPFFPAAFYRDAPHMTIIIIETRIIDSIHSSRILK
jgi:hypothetical protein